MDTLHERLADLADEAPTGGAPAAELWARGRRAHRLRAAAVAATVLVVGGVGTGLGLRLADGDDGSDLAPAVNVDISLPIEYPVGEKLPDLGETPGPLAAIWVAPGADSGAHNIVGLVAETGTFGTLAIDLPEIPSDPEASNWPDVELSPDGRSIAYLYPRDDVVVRDLVSGEEHVTDFEFGVRHLDGWVDATHILGHVLEGGDASGAVWEPGSAPTLVDAYSVPYGESGLSVPGTEWGIEGCEPPTLQDVQFRQENGGGWAGAFQVPALCNILGVTDSGLVLGRWRDLQDDNGTVVALDVNAADPPLGTALGPAQPGAAVFADPALRQVVATAGGPERVRFATALIDQALKAAGGAS